MEKENISDMKEAAKDTTVIFLGEVLDSNHLELFGKRAIQKLEDYFNYIEIYNNKAYDSTLRVHAEELAAELFIGEKPLVITIAHEPDSLKFRIKNAVFQLPRAINDSVYRGVISYDESTSMTEEVRKNIGFIIKRVNKKFGNEQSLIWEVYLEQVAI